MNSFLVTAWDLIKTAILVALLAWVIKGSVFQPFMVDGMSMEPNFHDREYILVNKLTYRLREPIRGDVVVFRAPDRPEYDYIKRVIGLPGDKVLIRGGQIIINDNLLVEQYLSSGEKTLINSSEESVLELSLKPDQYFVLGDNRDHSSDSREFGILPKTNIVGKAWIAVYPKSVFGFIGSSGQTLNQITN